MSRDDIKACCLTDFNFINSRYWPNLQIVAVQIPVVYSLIREREAKVISYLDGDENQLGKHFDRKYLET